MVKAVFIQNPSSIYKDRPGEAYHFPKRYLPTVRNTVGDWAIFYENRSGAFGYVSVQKVLKVIPDSSQSDHFYAIMDVGSEWSFERVVPRADPSNVAYETSLRGADGRPSSGGANVSAVRKLSEVEFAAIVEFGLAETRSSDSLPRSGPLPSHSIGFADAQADFNPAQLITGRDLETTSRKIREPSFARQVKTAYGARCAISGLSLRNGRGRPEVVAAHIRPVANDGPDTVRNGLALSGTVHWLFDRGLIGIADDYSILISDNKIPKETAARLITRDQKLLLPKEKRHYPHPDYLRFHREEIFGQLS